MWNKYTCFYVHLYTCIFLTLLAFYYLYHLHFNVLKQLFCVLYTMWSFFVRWVFLQTSGIYVILVKISAYMCITWAIKLYPLLNYFTISKLLNIHTWRFKQKHLQQQVLVLACSCKESKYEWIIARLCISSEGEHIGLEHERTSGTQAWARKVADGHLQCYTTPCFQMCWDN